MLDALCHKQMEGCFVSSGGLGMEMHVSLCFPVGTLSLQQFPSRLQSQNCGSGCPRSTALDGEVACSFAYSREDSFRVGSPGEGSLCNYRPANR